MRASKHQPVGEPLIDARRAIDELEANGASFTYRAAAGALPPTFTYELRANGDRQRCRNIIASAKADPALWSAVVAEIRARTAKAPA